MVKNKVAILQEIVDRHGDCDGLASPAICKRCPLGNKRINGRRVNCMDYLKITPAMTEEEVSEAYEKAAEDELFKIELEDVLSQD